MDTKEKSRLFAICKHKETEEYHVFITHLGKDLKCYFSSKESICGSMLTTDKENCIISCASTEQIRLKAADVGARICGNCMKSIYKTGE